MAARMRVPETPGLLVNGFLALGDAGADSSVAEDRLVKCGIRFRTKKALSVQGSLGGGAGTKTQGVDVSTPIGKTVELRVVVDLGAAKVTFTADGHLVEAKLDPPLKAVTHVGYAVDNAVAEFSAIEIKP